MSRLSCLILFSVFFVVNSFAQKNNDILIEWESPKLYESDLGAVLAPSIKGQQLDGNLPNFYWRQEIIGSAQKINLEILSTERAKSEEIDYLNGQKITIGDVKCETSVSNAGSKKYAVINLLPFVNEAGDIRRIKKIRITFEKGGPNNAIAQKDFVASSVLQAGSGDWYKISVEEDGIYKIDKNFLAELGIDVENVNPQDINIYGNGDGRLPELNSVPRTDDLAKNAIEFIGEGDGVIDDGDYILFYGWGPDRWYANGTTDFYRNKHVYSDVSCYFINVNPSETPLRIGNIAESSNAVTNNVNSFSYFDAHENDNVSIVNGGQRWYGELFDEPVMQRTFTFNIPNLDVSVPVEFEVSIASNTNSSAGTSQTYSVGGNQLYTTTLPAGSDYGRSVSNMNYTSTSDLVPLTISIVRNSPDILTYLDKITLNARRNLVFSGDQFNFRDLQSVGIGNTAQFTISNYPASNAFVWEVTNRHIPQIVNGNASGTDFIFAHDVDSLREYVISNGVDFLEPNRLGIVNHQNLHALSQADYIIVTHGSYKSQADRLADLHRANGLEVHVVDVNDIYNEFSSGMQDATAIRSFMKMFWDRGALAPETRPKSLLLFGDGTYDPKNRVANNNNYILTYQVLNSENHISAMPSDDYFVLLDDSEAILSTDQVDVGVGRLLVSSGQMAKEQVDKIEHYMRNGSNLYSTANTNCSSDNGSSTFGDWRTKYVQIADDEESNYFLQQDVEPQFEYVKDSFPEMNCEKIYSDAYEQVTTAGGARYPDVNEAINSKIERGALIVNYVGHGGEVGLAEERIITVPQIQDWRNIDVLPLFVSATCEFTKFDDPDRVSAGEWASLNPYGAAIALMTTTRSVFFGTNTQIGKKFFENVFERDLNNDALTFGEIIMRTKNAVGGDNKRSFTLIGDPALKLSLPKMKIFTDSINGLDPSVEIDTINALSYVTIKGHVEDYSGGVLTSFNGTLYPSVYDKPKEQQTLSNDGAASPEYTFYTQTNKVYAGKASVKNGYFEFDFVVPKDINYAIDFGKISYYAENGQYDAIGFDTMFYIGGLDPNGLNDNEGPQIDLYLNDESFVDGGISDETPILIAKLFDENGINTVGNGIGHDLVAVLDGNTGDPIVLNDFYTAALDSFQRGEIRYNFSSLEKGEHTLSVKVWDVNNNSAETSIRFVVQEKEEMQLDHVLNYPNPFTTHTDFYFEHNQVCNQLEVQIQVFTVSGRLVKTINQYVMTEGFRSEAISWDGRDDFGDQLAKGVYVYRVKVKTPEGNIAEKLEKLVILK